MQTSKGELIYKSDARRAILKIEPRVAFCIDNIKPVDAVEVVRCKDCKEIASCRIREVGFFTEDGYCQYGERRNEE